MAYRGVSSPPGRGEGAAKRTHKEVAVEEEVGRPLGHGLVVELGLLDALRQLRLPVASDLTVAKPSLAG